MPFVEASSVWKPGVNWSWAMRRSEFLTASTMFFVADEHDALLDARQGLELVGVDADGEDAVAWHAASRAPLPVRPPAPKMTSAPLSIICFAALLPWGGSVNDVV